MKNVLICKITILVIEQVPWKSDSVTLYVLLGYADDFSRSFSNKGLFRDTLKKNNKIYRI